MFYGFARGLLLLVSKVLFRIRIDGTEHVPTSGAFIVAPSHRSYLDTPFVSFITRRKIRFMAKEELFENSFGRRLFTTLGGIPVTRGSASARSAMKEVRAALEAGEPAAIFPEGTRVHGPTIAPLFDGTAYLAVKLGVPIVPVGIGGSEEILASGKKLPKLHKVAVKVGAPIHPPADATTRRRADLVALSDELMKSLQSLFDDARADAGCD
ncbi:MAG: lysophospholipid acyltransferase family protein [Acidimicrobiia bacterium]